MKENEYSVLSIISFFCSSRKIIRRKENLPLKNVRKKKKLRTIEREEKFH